MASRFTVLYGPLGVGKSSRAPGWRRPQAARGRLGRRSRHQRLLGRRSGARARPCSRGAARRRAAGSASSRSRTGSPRLTSRFDGDVYVVFDQFEELFVYPRAEGFAAALAEVVRAPHLRVERAACPAGGRARRARRLHGPDPERLRQLPLARAPGPGGGPRARSSGRSPGTTSSSGPAVEIEPELVEAVLDEVDERPSRLGGPLRRCSRTTARRGSRRHTSSS